MKRNFLVIILLLLFTIPAVKSLFIPGGFTAHDLTHHVVRQISMDKLLSEGQFPPRWSGELAYGYGYPVFLFNYPLPAMIGEVFHKAGFNFVDSVKGVLFLSLILSVLGMYLFLNSLLGSKLAAFLGAVFYLYAPIRFIYIYVSGSVGAALALGILPFVFWSLVEIKNGKKWASLIGSLSFALLILSHNVTTLIFTPVLLIFGWKRWRMFLLGLGLSAWFWLPAILEKQYIIFDEVFKDFYKDQFINFWQLIRSPWGYGLSHPQNPEPGDMSYQLGLIHFLVVGLLSFCLLFFKKIRVLGGFVLFFFWGSVFLILKISMPLWENLPLLALVQFPLRFSSVAIFSASIAAALLVKYLPQRKILFVGLLILVIYANRNHWRINEVFNPGEDYYLNLKTTTTSFNEHLPKWVTKMRTDVTLSQFSFISGVGDINVSENKSARVLAQFDSTASAKLQFNQYYFPGWQIKIDGKKIEFDYLNRENNGLPTFNIDLGSHQILAEFKNTPIRNLADFISLISVILWIGFLCKLLIANLLKIKKFF